MLDIYVALEGRRGLKVSVVHAPRPWTAGERVGSCDPAVLALLRGDARLTPALNVDGCVLFAAHPALTRPSPPA